MLINKIKHFCKSSRIDISDFRFGLERFNKKYPKAVFSKSTYNRWKLAVCKEFKDIEMRKYINRSKVIEKFDHRLRYVLMIDGASLLKIRRNGKDLSLLPSIAFFLKDMKENRIIKTFIFKSSKKEFRDNRHTFETFDRVDLSLSLINEWMIENLGKELKQIISDFHSTYVKINQIGLFKHCFYKNKTSKLSCERNIGHLRSFVFGSNYKRSKAIPREPTYDFILNEYHNTENIIILND